MSDYRRERDEDEMTGVTGENAMPNHHCLYQPIPTSASVHKVTINCIVFALQRFILTVKCLMTFPV